MTLLFEIWAMKGFSGFSCNFALLVLTFIILTDNRSKFCVSVYTIYTNYEFREEIH